MKQIGNGAEAIIYLDKNVIKDRVKKTYRIKAIDEKLRKSRTKRESKILKKLEDLKFPAPNLEYVDLTSMKIRMGHVKGDKVRDALESSDYKKLCREIGRRVADLHNNDIIHGDLTTSNMILNDKVHFIDFGLSFFSKKLEDKAVDLHLLRQALESKHHKIWKKCFDSVLQGYKKSEHYKDIRKRFEVVEARGRHKTKAGS